MPIDPITLSLLVAAVLALCLCVLLRAQVGAARRDLATLRAHSEGRDVDLRSERDAHGTARSDIAGLSATIEGLEARIERAATDADRHATQAHEERERLSAKLEIMRDEMAELRVINEGLRTEQRTRLEAHTAEVALLRDLREDMTNRFKALADATLEVHGTRFGTLNQERMTALLTPMREQVDHFQRELRDAHTGAAKDRERLKAEIEQLTRRSEEVSREAIALTNALKGDKQKQGAWGEMILERLLEDSGLAKGREYETQFSVRDEEGGRRRPDVVVRLPGEKVVVIDAKVSLVAYEAAVNAPDGVERQRNMRAHVAACRAHIDELATRDYASMIDGSVDYVLMFMPVEGALAAALEMQGDLTAYAISKRVGIATPTTLMMALRTIQHVWAVETRQRNAEEIADRAGKLHDKVAGVVEAFATVGDSLTRAQQAHTTALDRLSRGSGNVLGQVDKLRLLGARTRKPWTSTSTRRKRPPPSPIRYTLRVYGCSRPSSAENCRRARIPYPW